jgi:1,4-alpha-glucan branching enzyme
MIKDLNHYYLEHAALWEHDFDSRGFEWIDFSDSGNSVISYLRKGAGKILLCVHNFTPVYFGSYVVNLRNASSVREIFNTDAECYGGSGQLNTNPRLWKGGVDIVLAPLATMMFEVEF